jgi:proline iminopeptidase
VQSDDVTLASDIADLEKVRQYFHLGSVVLLGHSGHCACARIRASLPAAGVSHDPHESCAGIRGEDYKQLRKDWLEKRAADMERRKVISASAAYKEGDPDAVTAYYRIHFKPALA